MSKREGDPAKRNLIITLLGRKGMGKTYTAWQVIEGEPRVIALDTMGEYAGRGATVTWGKEGAIRAMLEASKKRRYRLSLRGLDEDEMLDALEMAWELPDSLVVVEEASMICRASYLPRELARLVRYGRHRNISQLYIARRPSELPRDLTAQSDLIVTLQQTEPVDVKYLRAAGFKERELLALAAMPEDQARGYLLVKGDRSLLPLAIAERLDAQKPLPGVTLEMPLTDDPDPDSDSAEGEDADREAAESPEQ